MKVLCTIVLTLLCLQLGAQKSQQTPAVFGRLNFVFPSFILEVAPSDQFSFSAGIWIRPTLWQDSESKPGTRYYNPKLTGSVKLEPRFFFNHNYRKSQGLRTDFQSGWYAGLPFRLEFPELSFSMGTTIGFQCTFGRRWFWNAGMGPGVKYKEGSFKIRPIFDTGFGLIISQGE